MYAYIHTSIEKIAFYKRTIHIYHNTNDVYDTSYLKKAENKHCVPQTASVCKKYNIETYILIISHNNHQLLYILTKI